jgi:hypothetical protein
MFFFVRTAERPTRLASALWRMRKITGEWLHPAPYPGTARGFGVSLRTAFLPVTVPPFCPLRSGSPSASSPLPACFVSAMASEAMGDAEAAAEARLKGLVIVRSMASSLGDEELRDSFLARPDVATLRHAAVP